MSLRELQARFAASLAASDGADRGMAIYRNTIRANYRNALAATYPVVRALVGNAFFNAAADAYATAYPSTSGDLDVFGDRLSDFLAGYAHARDLPYVPDVARLEWSIDESGRAADIISNPHSVISALATVPTEELGQQRFALNPSCRFVRSPYPLFTIWQVHQASYAGPKGVDLGQGASHVLVRRSREGIVVEAIAEAEFGWLTALDGGALLAAAVAFALGLDEAFELGGALHSRIADGTLVSLATS